MPEQSGREDPEPWQVLSTQRPFQNRWLRVAVDEVQLPTGRRYAYTRLEPGGTGVGVGVLGFDDARRVLLEREYRHGVGQVVWQLPGGLADPDEDLQVAGLRELAEETGYAPAAVSAQTVRYLGAIWDNPAFGPMHSHIFAAWGLQPTGRPALDAAEFVTLHWQPVEWLLDAVRSGEIRDRVVVAAVGYLLLNGWIQNEEPD